MTLHGPDRARQRPSIEDEIERVGPCPVCGGTDSFGVSQTPMKSVAETTMELCMNSVMETVAETVGMKAPQ